MPKSKRNRVIPLSKVTKKGPGEKKERQVKNIHKYLKQYKYCYAFTYKNMTNLSMNALKRMQKRLLILQIKPLERFIRSLVLQKEFVKL